MGKKAARDAERRALAMQHNQGRIIIKGKWMDYIIIY
jgi:hypothetical protein